MCKIQEFVASLDRTDLVKVRDLAEARLRTMKPLTIREVFKRCGKPGCSCQSDDVLRHGPYLIASFTQDGKQRQKNLGRLYLEYELDNMADEPAPIWTDYIVKNGELDKTSDRYERWDAGWEQRWLDRVEFEAYYKINVDDDTLNRPRELWYSSRKFDASMSRWNEVQDIARNEFSSYGVGTAKGIAILRGLETQGFYLAKKSHTLIPNSE